MKSPNAMTSTVSFNAPYESPVIPPILDEMYFDIKNIKINVPARRISPFNPRKPKAKTDIMKPDTKTSFFRQI